ncbi:putative metallocarboxypeptidase [Venturia nashicola]|uniref:HECT-type E3 ubiquitin transferase n=1 Tax=Venturia nashicola TaxID=86259 RepID=A0A4Z1P515_9PEZI|nr:putative metallocarboxypeptidase [Venturia nashicola]TLD21776.1 putative metallocarboxypeptidase [Venturia nashicola]
MAFQSFTGSSRRPRQVNLGGTRNNPFGAVQSAQQERERRQREREKLQAAKTLQRTWRGHSSRKAVREQRRTAWDTEEQVDGEGGPYQSEEQAWGQLQRLSYSLRLENDTDGKDINRLRRYMDRLHLSQQNGMACASGPWPMAYLRLQKLVLTTIPRTAEKDWIFELETIFFLGQQIPKLAARNARLLYQTLADINRPTFIASEGYIKVLPVLVKVLKGPLPAVGPESADIYEAFACEFLTKGFVTEDPWYPKWLSVLADDVNYKMLACSLSSTVSSKDYNGYKAMDNPQSRLNLLGCLIYFHRHAHHFQNAQAYSSHKDFVLVTSKLLSSIADSRYLDALQNPKENEDAIGKFAREQIMTLVDKESVSSLLQGASTAQPRFGGPPQMNSEAKQLANYALTLIRFFPRDGDNIRMWLYWGSSDASAAIDSKDKLPAIKFFWQAARNSMVFKTISQDTGSDTAIKLIRPQSSGNGASEDAEHAEWVQDDWRLILIFLELYTFVLRLMDDDEFFSASSLNSSGTTSTGNSSWARQNALPTEDIQHLTSFLKIVGFAMYFHASEIADPTEERTQRASLSSHFRIGELPSDEQINSNVAKTPETAIAGLSGISIDYVKGLVTGLLRMVHERDSRRKFLPADHWLISSSFDMNNFIPDVVAEEENRHRLEEEADDDVIMADDDPEEDRQLIGTARDRSIRYHARLESQQRLYSRKRYMQAVAPRSEILQNMPFFIPFTTRVQIFREFVRRDKFTRRRGHVDSELWRMHLMNSFDPNDNIGRHTATIKRGNEFEDAFEQFYSLGEGLKEPIQITFVDKWGQQEAGIDGGGVTKEFLTSVTSQAFTPTAGQDLFAENEQHLLYPYPAAIDEKLATMKDEMGLTEDMPVAREQIKLMLQHYEFLGRVIGKCLYEGILVDINFAGFFLLKWALTGGDGQASNESGYRANVNDLRDMDEDLYKGLMQLKNYTGDVEDFALNFTVSDTLTIDYATGKTKVITRNLVPDGANKAVTNSNRLTYIWSIVQYRLAIQPQAQTRAFLKGLSSMISPSWLSMFNQTELQTLIGGTSSSIDIADLRRHTHYGGLYIRGDDPEDHPTIQLFWRVMESFNDKERRAVLKFITSTPRAPLLGFASLQPAFSIRDSGDDETRLPSASTCVNLMKLPRYKSEKVMREKLLYAVMSGAGFDLS